MDHEKEINYSEEIEQSTVLGFPHNVRRRPGTYIGPTDNPDVILREVVDNSIDEMFDSHANKSIIDIVEDVCYVCDNGRGIPIGMHHQFTEMTNVEVSFSKMHAGTKFKKTTANIGMNGLGTKATNALSEYFVVLSKVTKYNFSTSVPSVDRMWREFPEEDLYYYIQFGRGEKIGEGCLHLGEINYELSSLFGTELELPEGMSTYTVFRPDSQIFKSIKADLPRQNLINSKLIFRKFRNKEVNFTYKGKDVTEEVELYKYTGFTQMDIQDKEFNDKVDFLVSFEFSENLKDRVSTGSVNSLVTNRGLHIDTFENLFKTALREVFSISHDTLLPGLKLYVVCLVAEADFDSQTKSRLVTIHGHHYSERQQMLEFMKKIMRDNKDEIQVHVDRLNALAESLVSIAAIDKLKAMINIDGDHNKFKAKLPKGVFDASSRDRMNCELIIVEGKSAANNVIKARTKRAEFVGVLPLRGRPLNSIYKSYEQLLDNPEMSDLISVIGCGINIHNSLDNPRYGKIIVAADADADGSAIAALMIGAIAYHMTFLVKAEMVYVAETPLYSQGGKYIYPSDDTEVMLDRSKPYKRFKGLGELNVDEMRDSLIDEDKRRLRLVTLTDLELALQLLTSSTARKKLMYSRGVGIDPYGLETDSEMFADVDIDVLDDEFELES